MRGAFADLPTMLLPLIPLAIGALIGGAGKKKAGREAFVAVKGRLHKDGTVGKPSIRRKPKSK
jgi:hypothetical protein